MDEQAKEYIRRITADHRKAILATRGADWETELPIVDAMERADAEQSATQEQERPLESQFGILEVSSQGIRDVTPADIPKFAPTALQTPPSLPSPVAPSPVHSAPTLTASPRAQAGRVAQRVVPKFTQPERKAPETPAPPVAPKSDNVSPPQVDPIKAESPAIEELPRFEVPEPQEYYEYKPQGVAEAKPQEPLFAFDKEAYRKMLPEATPKPVEPPRQRVDEPLEPKREPARAPASEPPVAFGAIPENEPENIPELPKQQAPEERDNVSPPQPVQRLGEIQPLAQLKRPPKNREPEEKAPTQEKPKSIPKDFGKMPVPPAAALPLPSTDVGRAQNLAETLNARPVQPPQKQEPEKPEPKKPTPPAQPFQAPPQGLAQRLSQGPSIPFQPVSPPSPMSGHMSEEDVVLYADNLAGAAENTSILLADALDRITRALLQLDSRMRVAEQVLERTFGN